MLLGEPPRTQYDLNLLVAGVPVRVHPFFWLAGVVLGASSGDGASILIWVGALFVSILVHELGHAFTMRYYGESPRVVLYMMGGLAIRDSSPYEFGSSRSRSSRQQIIISAAGPGAGFLLAALVIILVYAGGGAVTFNPRGHILMPLRIELHRGAQANDAKSEALEIEPDKILDDEAGQGNQLPSETRDDEQRPRNIEPPRREKNNNVYLYELIRDMLFINILWGMVNLLPVYPLDGGQIAREVLVQKDPWDGLKRSLWLSVITGGGVAVAGLLFLGEPFIAIMFGLLAFSSWQVLQQISGGGGGFGGGGGPWGGGGRPW